MDGLSPHLRKLGGGGQRNQRQAGGGKGPLKVGPAVGEWKNRETEGKVRATETWFSAQSDATYGLWRDGRRKLTVGRSPPSRVLTA